MSPSTPPQPASPPILARIDDATTDTRDDNTDAVEVSQALEVLATRSERGKAEDEEYGDYALAENGYDTSDLEDFYTNGSVDESDYTSDEPVDTAGAAGNIEEEDWHNPSSDFTKLYNRLRQHQQVILTNLHNSNKNGTQGNVKGEADTEADMPLPARNVRKMGGAGASAVKQNGEKGDALGERRRRAIERRNREAKAASGEVGPGAGSEAAAQPEASTSQLKPKPSKQPNGNSTAPPSLLQSMGVPSFPKSNPSQTKDKSDRSTVDSVLDPRTIRVLTSLIRRGWVDSVEGCISTGKEANVYFAPGPVEPPVEEKNGREYPDPYPEQLAVKIYKTSILSFKSRGNYIERDQRFKNSYTKGSNARKMVKVWAEKELRNLRRLDEAGIRCPKVVGGRENVLVMEFLGRENQAEEGKVPSALGNEEEEVGARKASPRLKDAEDLQNDELRELYAELLVAMRWMYHRCKLVHADLSEYNILYHKSHLYIIDVSQSVEHDHPSAFDFLRKDIKNINEFFLKRSEGELRTLGIRGAFKFIVNDDLGVRGEETEEALKELVRDWLEKGVGSRELQGEDGLAGGAEGKENTSAADDEVFMKSYIPRNLGEVFDPERDIDVIASGQGDNLIYAGVVGLSTTSGKNASKTRAEEPTELAEEATGEPEGRRKSILKGEESLKADPSGSESEKKGVRWEDQPEESEEEEEDEEDEDGDEERERKPRGFRHEDKESKKERKKAVKEAKREKREHKMPKAEKQRRVKATAHSRG